jgi:hypothetical protein
MKLPQPPRKDDLRFNDWLALLWKFCTGVTPDNFSGLNTLPSYANDAAAAAGGVPVGGMYRNGSVLMVRVA